MLGKIWLEILLQLSSLSDFKVLALICTQHTPGFDYKRPLQSTSGTPPAPLKTSSTNFPAEYLQFRKDECINTVYNFAIPSAPSSDKPNQSTHDLNNTPAITTTITNRHHHKASSGRTHLPPASSAMNAHALLTSQGWRGAGHSLHPTSDRNGLTHHLLIKRNADGRGLGSRKEDHKATAWWASAFDQALRGLDVGKAGTAMKQTVAGGGGALAKITARAAGKYTGAKGLYTSFVRGGVMEGTCGDGDADGSGRKGVCVGGLPTPPESGVGTPVATGDGGQQQQQTKETKEERRARREARRRRKAEKQAEKEAEERAARKVEKKKAKKAERNAVKNTETKEERRARRDARRKRKEVKRRLKASGG
ncbi:hypothetical protein F5B20DRAFT_583383 [Whalleya microplaca]|nr:hypothetical protein F5B20DRAFT_583383 [Whalleya microplaca]